MRDTWTKIRHTQKRCDTPKPHSWHQCVVFWAGVSVFFSCVAYFPCVCVSTPVCPDLRSTTIMNFSPQAGDTFYFLCRFMSTLYTTAFTSLVRSCLGPSAQTTKCNQHTYGMRQNLAGMGRWFEWNWDLEDEVNFRHPSCITFQSLQMTRTGRDCGIA